MSVFCQTRASPVCRERLLSAVNVSFALSHSIFVGHPAKSADRYAKGLHDTVLSHQAPNQKNAQMCTSTTRTHTTVSRSRLTSTVSRVLPALWQFDIQLRERNIEEPIRRVGS